MKNYIRICFLFALLSFVFITSTQASCVYFNNITSGVKKLYINANDAMINTVISDPYGNETISRGVICDGTLCFEYSGAPQLTFGLSVDGPLSTWDYAQDYSIPIMYASEGMEGFDSRIFTLDMTTFFTKYNKVANSYEFSLSQEGNYVFLNYQVLDVPEPSVFMLLGGIFGVAFCLYRKTRGN